MRPELQRRVQRYGWNKATNYYEKFWQKQLSEVQNKLVESMDFKEGEVVTDISCGTGLVTFPISMKVGTSGKVFANDISDAMVNKLKNTAEQKGIANIICDRMDAEELNYESSFFDAAVCSLGMMYFPNPEKAMAEMYRVLKSEGKAGALVWGERKNCGWAEIFPIVDARVKSDVCPLFFQLGTANLLKHEFASAGFKNINIFRIKTTLDFKNDEEAIGAAFVGGPVALAYSRFDDKTREEAHKEYLDSIAKYENHGGYAIPGEFVIATGLKD